jgi:hypothetical protein
MSDSETKPTNQAAAIAAPRQNGRPGNDYDKDLPRQHYQRSRHHGS